MKARHLNVVVASLIIAVGCANTTGHLPDPSDCERSAVDMAIATMHSRIGTLVPVYAQSFLPDRRQLSAHEPALASEEIEALLLLNSESVSLQNLIDTKAVRTYSSSALAHQLGDGFYGTFPHCLIAVSRPLCVSPTETIIYAGRMLQVDDVRLEVDDTITLRLEKDPQGAWRMKNVSSLRVD